MATGIYSRQSDPKVEELIARLDRATDPREITWIADHIRETRDARTIRPLLLHLGDRGVQDDNDAECAVCGALMSLGVMCKTGSCSFGLRPRNDLADDVVETIRELAGVIPWQYFGARQI